jgi:Protein of unknown function (DUF998)
MTHDLTTPRAGAAGTSATRALLAGGVVAGPLFILVGLLQAFTREGFDLRRHPLSLLSNGDLGWIQITNFVVTGLLFTGAAVGMRRVLHPGRGGTWGPLLIGAVGVGMVAAGVFVADPADGFPPGTPPGRPDTLSWHSGLHFLVAGLAYLALIAASFVFAAGSPPSANGARPGTRWRPAWSSWPPGWPCSPGPSRTWSPWPTRPRRCTATDGSRWWRHGYGPACPPGRAERSRTGVLAGRESSWEAGDRT